MAEIPRSICFVPFYLFDFMSPPSKADACKTHMVNLRPPTKSATLSSLGKGLLSLSHHTLRGAVDLSMIPKKIVHTSHSCIDNGWRRLVDGPRNNVCAYQSHII